MTAIPLDELKLEIKEEANKTAQFTDGNGVVVASLSPAVDENYWLLRVRLNDTGQAVLGFPKYSTIGIGFAQEEYWNTNLPYRCETDEILAHILRNKADAEISDECVRKAIEMIQAGAHRTKGTDPADTLPRVPR